MSDEHDDSVIIRRVLFTGLALFMLTWIVLAAFQWVNWQNSRANARNTAAIAAILEAVDAELIEHWTLTPVEDEYTVGGPPAQMDATFICAEGVEDSEVLNFRFQLSPDPSQPTSVRQQAPTGLRLDSFGSALDTCGSPAQRFPVAWEPYNGSLDQLTIPTMYQLKITASAIGRAPYQVVSEPFLLNPRE